MILNASILNGALELLPQSIASMAIIPLQMKLVYRIGQAHGYESDKTQIRDLLATLGVGTDRPVPRADRAQAASGGCSARWPAASPFAGAWRDRVRCSRSRRPMPSARWRAATTPAAVSMSTELLQAHLQRAAVEGKTLQAQYLPQIEQQARSLDPVAYRAAGAEQLAGRPLVRSRSCTPEADLARRFGGVARLYGDDRRCTPARGPMSPSSASAASAAGRPRRSPAVRSAVITLIDMDHIAESNTNRQIHALGDAYGQAKVDAMAKRIADINPSCEIRPIDEFVTRRERGAADRRLRHRARLHRPGERQGGADRAGARRQHPGRHLRCCGRSASIRCEFRQR